MIYSLDRHRRFQPRRLTEATTPAAIEKALVKDDFQAALFGSLALNDAVLIERTLYSVPFTDGERLNTRARALRATRALAIYRLQCRGSSAG